MKTLLKTLAIIYLIFSVIMFFLPYAIIARIIVQSFSADSFLMIILALVISFIPLIVVFCSIRFLRRKDLESACDISLITGILVSIITSGLISRFLLLEYAGNKFIALALSIAFGVIAHKVFHRNLKRHFGDLALVG
jgi:hypothetical protein